MLETLSAAFAGNPFFSGGLLLGGLGLIAVWLREVPGKLASWARQFFVVSLSFDSRDELMFATLVEYMNAQDALRGSHNSNDRVGESIERLMAAIVRVAVTRGEEPAIERVQLLGGNVESVRRDGLLEYEIPSRLRRIIKDSTVFARLQREVMFALTSKYALTLYEMVQKRGNLRWR